jgi:hypothetical protein
LSRPAFCAWVYFLSSSSSCAYFLFPDGDTGQDCLAGLVFLLAIDRFSEDVILLAALAGRHAG